MCIRDSISSETYGPLKALCEQEVLQAMPAHGLVVRPGLIGGERQQSRPAERLAIAVTRGLAPVLPRRYRVVPASQIAAHLLAAAVQCRPGVHVLESERLLDPVPVRR